MTPEQERLYLAASCKAKLVAACDLLRDAMSDIACAGFGGDAIAVEVRRALGCATTGRYLSFAMVNAIAEGGR